MTKSNLWVVIPAFNESEMIGSVLSRVLTVCPRVVLVDDGSTDDTANQARRFPVHFLRHVINLGQGAALMTGIRYALDQGADVIVTFDADDQMDEHEIAALAGPVYEGQAEVTLGSRFLSGPPEAMPVLRRILLSLAIQFTRLTTGLALTDTHNGFRAFSRRAAESLNFQQDRMAHASEIFHIIGRAGWSYKEIPVTIRYSAYSLQKGQRTADLLHILWDLLFKQGS